jgi:hypothetical protein
MDRIKRRLLIVLLIVLLAGCAQKSEPQAQSTLPPPPDTPASDESAQSGQQATATPLPETATPPPVPTMTAVPTETATSSPLPTATATAVPPTATATSTRQTEALETAEPTAAATAPSTQPPSADGSTADLVDRGLLLDVTGVASMYAWTIERTVPQVGPPLPAYLLMTFDSYKSEEPLAKNAPLLSIFPLEHYLALARSAGNVQPEVQDQVTRLWQLLEADSDQNSEAEGWMPLLPPAASPIEDWSDFAKLDFIHGRGLRYTRIVNGELVYTYLGMTEDGAYAVTFTWPLGGSDAPDIEALDTMIATLALGEQPIESP